MMSFKEEKLRNLDKATAKAEEAEQLPSYQETGESSNTPAPPRAEESAAAQPGQPGGAGPSIFRPFDFPAQPPAYTTSSTASIKKSASAQKPVAIPQERPEPSSAFLQAYAPSLLGYGIPEDRWRPFVEAASAFLQAKVSERAVSHAAEVGRDIGAVTVGFGKDVAAHAKSVGREISDSAKRRDALGLVHGAFAGLVGLPVGTAIRAIGAALRLPSSTVAAVTKRPSTPRERTTAYLAVANRDWLHPRGLDARLLDSKELADLVGFSVEQIVALVREAQELGAENPLGVLGDLIAQLEFKTPANFDINAQTLWIVLVPMENRAQDGGNAGPSG